MTPADLQTARDARFHHSALVAQRAYMRNPLSIARNRQQCEEMRAVVRFIRNERRGNVRR